ncbi:MAG: NAD(P) transhydrogenase subunit alpha [Sulfobacillus sp.]
MYLAVPREVANGERRVALVPEAVVRLVTDKHQVAVEAGAGAGALLSDDAFQTAGAELVQDASELLARADLVLTVQGFGDTELSGLRPGTMLVGLLQPLTHPERIARLAEHEITAFSLDLMPRITRAQNMDVLSAMSTVSGYRAALLGAVLAERFFPLMMTAAGTVPPARVLVLGAGVAGLQAVATARRLGAVVQAFDTRPAVKEQVESLGGVFLTLPLPEGGEAQGGYARRLAEDEEALEQEVLAEPVQRADVVITTAMVPGARPPLLITEQMVASMHAGAVIMDLAAETGGNCALTVPGARTVSHGVIVDGSVNLPSQMPLPASQFYSRNLLAFVNHLFAHLTEDQSGPDLADEILAATCVTHGGKVVHAPTRQRLERKPLS